MAVVSSSIWRMAPPGRLQWRGSSWKPEAEPALNLRAWDREKQWEFAQRCEAPGPKLWPKFLDKDCPRLAGTPQAHVLSPSKERCGDGEEEEIGEQRWCHSKLCLCVFLSWVKRGKLKNPQNPNKPTLLPLSGCAAHQAIAGGLHRHRWDGADLPPSPVNSPSQDAAKKPCRPGSSLEARGKWPSTSRLGVSGVWGSLAGICMPGEGSEGPSHRELGESRCVALLLSPGHAQTYKTHLRQHQAQISLFSWSHTWAEHGLGLLVHVGCWGCPIKTLQAEGLWLLGGGQHCDNTSVSWVGLATLLSLLFPSVLMFTLLFSVI